MRQECPTIPNTRMPRGSRGIYGVTRGRESVGGHQIRRVRSHDGFSGISRLSVILWRTTSVDLVFDGVYAADYRPAFQLKDSEYPLVVD